VQWRLTVRSGRYSFCYRLFLGLYWSLKNEGEQEQEFGWFGIRLKSHKTATVVFADLSSHLLKLYSHYNNTEN
jgi:hypothetical protein